MTLRERKERSRKERRLLSELWLMSAATFRRSGKIEQVRGAIQEAEVKDEENPNVWVQVRRSCYQSQGPPPNLTHFTLFFFLIIAGVVPHRTWTPRSRRASVQQSAFHLSREHPRHGPPEPFISHARQGGRV